MARNAQMANKAAQIKEEVAKHEGKNFVQAGRAQPENLGAGSFSTYYTWRGHGDAIIRCGHNAINANSRVLVALSEFDSDAAQNRFIGDARMTVHNVAPYNGGVLAWIEVSFDTSLNVRLDVLVDP